MGAHVGKQVVKRMLAQGRNPLDSRILVMGLTFKETSRTSAIRRSPTSSGS